MIEARDRRGYFEAKECFPNLGELAYHTSERG